MDRDNLFGNIILLIIGGNDTTRNALTGSVLALNENPNEYEKLRSDHALIDSFVPEAIRWQTPIAHMRRTALRDTELGGKLITRGDRVVMWYVSGNRDSEVIADADRFVIDRERPRLFVGQRRETGWRGIQRRHRDVPPPGLTPLAWPTGPASPA